MYVLYSSTVVCRKSQPCGSGGQCGTCFYALYCMYSPSIFNPSLIEPNRTINKPSPIIHQKSLVKHLVKSKKSYSTQQFFPASGIHPV